MSVRLQCGCLDECHGHRVETEVVPRNGLRPDRLVSNGLGFLAGLIENRTGKKFYNGPVRDFVETVIAEHPAIPKETLTMADLARNVGILPEKQMERKKRRSVR